MELPILHDAFTIALKLHEQATHFPTYNQVESMVSNGIQILDAELSEEVKTGVARAVLSLDCFISSGLDKLTATVPSLANPTDKIFPSLKLADYILAFFGLSIHQGGPEQESQNQAMGVVEEIEEFQDKEEFILSSDRCPGIENLSKEECILCSSSMLLCSNLPHLPYVSKNTKEFQDEALKDTKETQYEDLEVNQKTQDTDLEVTTETQESQDEALDVNKETQESQDEATEVTGETQESRDEVTEVTDIEVTTEVPVEIEEYNEIMKDTEEIQNDTTEVPEESPKFFKETEKSQNDATEVTEETPKFFRGTEETENVIMEETEDTQMSQKDVLEVTEFIEVVDVIGAFEVVDVVESIEFIQVIDD